MGSANMKKSSFLLTIIIIFSLIIFNPVYAEPGIERGSNYLIEDLGGGFFAWQSAPQYVMNQLGEWVPYIFKDMYFSDGYYQVQSGLIGARIFDYYAELYSPDMSEVRVYDERWEIQYQGKNGWLVCDTYNPIISFNYDNEVVNITVSFITDWPNNGERAFYVKYIFKAGEPLKHEVSFTSYSTEIHTFRMIQKWSGIVASYLNGESVDSAQVFDTYYFKFDKNDRKLSVIENQYNAIEKLTPTSIDLHAQGLKADFVFSNWTLGQNQSLLIDPHTLTLSPPTKDSYTKEIDPTGNFGTDNDLYIESEDNDNKPTYIEWDTSSIPGGSTIISAEVRLYVTSDGMDDEITHFHRITGAWNETDITWNNDPAVDATIASNTPVSGTGWYNSTITNIFSLASTFGVQVHIHPWSLATPDCQWFLAESKEHAGGHDPILYVVYSQAPTAPTITGPTNSSRYDPSESVNVTWTFNDPDTGDTQSAYRLQVSNVSSFATTVVDTGKNSSSISYHVFSAPSSPILYYIRIKTWDNHDVEGAWSQNLHIIVDRIVAYWEQLNDTRLNIDATAEWRIKAVLDYDDHPLGSGDSISCSWGSLTWDASNSWFDITNTRSTVGALQISLNSGSEATYSISTFTENVTETNVIFDRIEVISLSASSSRAPVRQSVELWVTAQLDYDNHSLGSGDSITISSVAFAWDASDARFEATVSKDTPQNVTYNTFSSGLESTYGITSGICSLSIGVEWYNPPETGGGTGGSGAGGPSAPSLPSAVGEAFQPILSPFQKYGAWIIVFSIVGVVIYSQIRTPDEHKARKNILQGVLPDMKGLRKTSKKFVKKLKEDVWEI